MYKLTQNPNQIIRLSDGAIIPNAKNGDWQLYEKSLADGEIPLPADPLPVQPLIPDWAGFMESMRLYFPIGLGANYAVFTQIFNMLLALRDRQLEADQKNVEWQNFSFNFNLGRPAFTPQQMGGIEAAMIAANIPVIAPPPSA